MISESFAIRLFSSVDAQDVDGFVGSFTENGCLRFGNAPVLVGEKVIRETISGFFSAIGGLRHQLEEVWPLEDATICHGEVTYTRLDGGTLKVPFAVILKGQDDAISDYMIFVDNSALFAD